MSKLFGLKNVAGAFILSLLLGSYLSAADQEQITYKVSKAQNGVTATIVSPEVINATAHPIESSRPELKIHRRPFLPPVDKVAALTEEKYDPANQRYIVDKNADKLSKDLEGNLPCQSFQGITNTGWDPPDPHVAVGPTQVVEVVNSSIAIYDKATGVRLSQSTAGFWFQSTVPAPPSTFIYDPKIVYDPVAGRFIIFFLCTDQVSQAAYLVSVSRTSDAMGNWYNYNFDAGLDGAVPSGLWADYPGLGFDYNDAVYLTSNQWQFGTNGNFMYVKIRILPKSQLYAGGPVVYSDITNLLYQDNSSVFTIKPATTYSNADGEFLLSNIWFGANYTTYWKITDPLGLSGGPTIVRKPKVNVATYPAPPNAVQKGGQPIGTIGPMTQEVTYRNGKVYTSFDESFNWGSGSVSAIRMFGIDTVTSTATFDKVFGSDLVYYYFPSIYVDPAGKIYASFNRSSSSDYVGVYYVEDLMTDPSSKVLKAGENTRSGTNPIRWGDYSQISADGSDQTKVWLVNMYTPAAGNTWRTWIGEVPSKATQPILATPLDAATVHSPVSLTWDVSSPASHYELQIDDDTTFTTPVLDTVIGTNTFTATTLSDRSRYFWRTQGVAGCPGSPWSVKQSFKICNYVAGDANGDAIVNISDVVYEISYIFTAGPAPAPLASGDANCDSIVNISDAVYLIAFIFGSGPGPCNAC